MEITPLQALRNLYIAARRAPLTADEHDVIQASAVGLEKILIELNPPAPAPAITPAEVAEAEKPD